MTDQMSAAHARDMKIERHLQAAFNELEWLRTKAFKGRIGKTAIERAISELDELHAEIVRRWD